MAARTATRSPSARARLRQRLGPTDGAALLASTQNTPGTARRDSADPLTAEEAETDARVALGRAIFFDASLSEPAGTSCSSCHDPAHAFSSQNGSTLGVPRGSREKHFARRNAPSLLYLKYVPKFHYGIDDDDATVPSPFGGLFWDGRVDTITELVRGPLLNPDEMNGHDGATLATKIRQAPYAAAFEHAFGSSQDAKRTLTDVGQALEAFLTTDAMAPFSSEIRRFLCAAAPSSRRSSCWA